MKQASVESMEAYFNSDYDHLLVIAEVAAFNKSLIAYDELFTIITGQDFSPESFETRARMEGIMSALIFDIYRTVDGRFNPWYRESFGHLSNNSKQQIDVLYAGAVAELARVRSITIAPRLVDTAIASSTEDVENTVNQLSKRIAVTESNGAAGGIIQATALSMFTEAGLYKRWIATGDERVRNTHRLAASRKPIPLNQLYQVGDVLMKYPADPFAFGGNVAGEVVNCRCRSLVLPFTRTQPNSNSLNTFLFRNNTL